MAAGSPFAPSFPDGTRFDRDGKRLLAAHWVEKERLNEMCRKVIRRSCIHLDDPCYAKAYLNYGEDMLQTAYVLHHAATVYYCGKILYNYRINPTSITACVTLTQLKEVHSALRAKLWLLQTDYPGEASLLSAFYFRYMRAASPLVGIPFSNGVSEYNPAVGGFFRGKFPVFAAMGAAAKAAPFKI